MIHDRLHDFFERVPDDLPTAAKPFFRDDALFPLGEAWMAETMGDSAGFRPRDLMVQANDRWLDNQRAIFSKGATRWLREWPKLDDAVTGETTPPVPVDIDAEILSKVEEEKNRQRLQPGLLPPDGGNLYGILCRLLEYCTDPTHGYSLQSVEPGTHADELSVMEQSEGHSLRNFVKVVVTGNATATAARLRHLLQATDCQRRILVTDQRYDLALGATGKSYYQNLLDLGDGFKHYKLSLIDYAELHAMLAVIGEANSGDVEVRDSDRTWRKLTPDDVVQCFHRNNYFRKQTLLAEFLCEPTTIEPIKPLVMDESGFRDYVRSRLALLMGANLSELLRRFILEQQLSISLDEMMPAPAMSSCRCTRMSWWWQRHGRTICF